MKILIVDDEAPARARLRLLLDDLAQTQPAEVGHLVAEAGDANSALALLGAWPADVVLLDIGLPGGGLQLAAALQRWPKPPALVFVTAHEGHALAAFDLAAVDYLTKPVRAERLLAALQRVQGRRADGVAAGPAPALARPACLVIEARGRVLRLPLTEVLWLQAGGKQVQLRTPALSLHLDEPLAELEQRLLQAGGRFLRVHRKALVAFAAVRELARRADDADGNETWAVRVAPLDDWLPVSRRQLGTVRAALVDRE